MAKGTEMKIVEQAYNNAVLHPPSPFLQWISVVFILLIVTGSLIALVSLYYVAKDIYKNIRQRKGEFLKSRN